MNIGGAIAATAVINILCVGRKFVYQINSSFDHIRYSSKGTTLGKKMFSFGHCPNEGGGRPLLELKNIIYIYVFLTAEKDVQVAQKRGRKENILFPRRCSLTGLGGAVILLGGIKSVQD